jgi:hypothetical protein
LNNNTAGVRERKNANCTREAGHLDEIQGVVASTLILFRNGAVGFIDFHEKVFKLKFGFILECGRSGSCFHADSGIYFGPDLDPVARNHN